MYRETLTHTSGAAFSQAAFQYEDPHVNAAQIVRDSVHHRIQKQYKPHFNVPRGGGEQGKQNQILGFLLGKWAGPSLAGQRKGQRWEKVHRSVCLACDGRTWHRQPDGNKE